MQFEPAHIPGVVVVHGDAATDSRGTFERVYDAAEFANASLDPQIAQVSVSRNPRVGTLRGLHYQAGDDAEAKLVRCIRGRVFDVAVDLRPDSPAHCLWFGIELDSDTPAALYIPRGCAHGFLTLTDNAELSYFISTPYAAESARGVRWNDPAFGIDWPAQPDVISDRDASFEDYQP